MDKQTIDKNKLFGKLAEVTSKLPIPRTFSFILYLLPGSP